MKRCLVGITLLLVLGACQGNEPEKTTPPASEPVASAQQAASAAAEKVADAVSESAAKAKSIAEAEAAKARSAAEAAAAKARSAAEAAAAQARSMADAAEAKASSMADSLTVAKTETKAAAVPAKPQAAAPVATKAVASAAAGDAASGKKLARKCAVCHSFDAKNKMGPGLAGIFGREAGSAAGFSYKFTDFIKPGKAWSWDEAHLAAWVCDSTQGVKSFTGDASAKTKMGVQRICDPAAQADLIAYLKTL